MDWSVVVDGKVYDVVCYKHPAEGFKNWYLPALVRGGDDPDIKLGQVAKVSGEWSAISHHEPTLNWMAEGYATRRAAINYLLRAANIYKRSY